MLTMISVQLASFLLYYFVCPWRDFTFQNTFERVLSVQLLIFYPLAQCTQTGSIFYMQTFYLRYRKQNKILKDWHYFSLTAISLVISAIQIIFTVNEKKRHQYFYIGRITQPIFQVIFLIIVLIYSLKASKKIDEDLKNKE